jgi:hypothetical protein
MQYDIVKFHENSDGQTDGQGATLIDAPQGCEYVYMYYIRVFLLSFCFNSIHIFGY